MMKKDFFQWRAMESGDHFKNGASPKSLTSRRNIRFFGTAVFMAAMLLNMAGLAKAQIPTVEEVRRRTKEPDSEEVQRLFLNAVVSNDTARVKLFLENGASANYYESSSDYWRRQRFGNDPLITAINNNANDVAVLLIKSDKSVLYPRIVTRVETLGNQRVNRILYVCSPVQYAIASKNEKILDYLIQEIFTPQDGDFEINEKIKNETLATDPISTATATATALDLKNMELAKKLINLGFKGVREERRFWDIDDRYSDYDFYKLLPFGQSVEDAKVKF
jgi:hypothetical protein